MVNRNTKYWFFTWEVNAAQRKLPSKEKLKSFFDRTADYAQFQEEVGEKKGNLHYQGRFKLKGSRLGKKRLLEIFEKIFETSNLTFEPEILYDSTKYCTKDETRKAGPFYFGTDSYREKMTPMTIKLRQWQKELLQEVKIVENDNARDRKVFWIEDSNGGAGKSTFSKFLSFGQKDWKVKKLPIDSPNRIRMAVCKILQKEDVDIFTFDFTRTMGEETSMNDLFQVINQENSHV